MLENISLELKQKMRKSKTRGSKREFTGFVDEREDDEIFIVEGIFKRDKDKYLVKCIGYEAEWMESKIIPSFLLEYFHSTGNTKIPQPHILSSIKTGNIVYNALTWKGELNLPVWNPKASGLFGDHDDEESRAENDDVEGLSGTLTCNTKKDKDTRFHRHTAGIFIGMETNRRHEKSYTLQQDAGRVGCVYYGMSFMELKVPGRSMG